MGGPGPPSAPMSGAGVCVVPIGPHPIVAPESLEEGSEELEDAVVPISGAQGGGVAWELWAWGPAER